MDLFFIIFLSGILIISAVIDLRLQRIPNLITMPAMLIALTGHTASLGTIGLFFSLKGLLIGIGLLIIPYLMGGMGAGDAKLMGAVGAIVGAEGVLISFLFTALFGGIYAVLIVFIKREQFQGFLKKLYVQFLNLILLKKYIPDPLQKPDKTQPRLCYGLAIALGSGLYIALKTAGYEFPL